MILAIALLLAAPEAADAGVPDQQLEQELQKALQADRTAKSAQQPAPPAATSGAAAPLLTRGSQSLNPDISVILDADFGWQRRPMSYLNGVPGMPAMFDIIMNSMQVLQHELGNFKAISADVRCALVDSFGFGGANACIVIGRTP